MPSVSIGEIVDLIGGRYAGKRDRMINAVAPLASANAEQLSFLSNRKYAAQLAVSKAGVILVPQNLEGEDDRWIRVDDPYFAIARIMTKWFGARPMPKGISAQASIAPSAKLGENVSVGSFTVIGDDVVIGDNTTIFQNVSIEAGSVLGDDCI